MNGAAEKLDTRDANPTSIDNFRRCSTSVLVIHERCERLTYTFDYHVDEEGLRFAPCVGRIRS